MGLDNAFVPHPVNMRTYEMVVLASSGGMCSVYGRVENCTISIDGVSRREEGTWKTRR